MFEFLTIASLAFSCDPSLGFCVELPAGGKIKDIVVIGVQSTHVCLLNEGRSEQFLRLVQNPQGWLVQHGPNIRSCSQTPAS
jgi:hypothetical protein